MNILIVDDQAYTRWICSGLANILIKQGYGVYFAVGIECVQAHLAVSNIGAIFLDSDMPPNEDGPTIARYIREEFSGVVFIHSMNPVSARTIQDLLSDYGRPNVIVPFGDLALMDINALITRRCGS